MGFYQEIALYYDYIFPTNPQQVSFIKDNQIAPKRILDIACGTGGYSIELAKQGHILTAVDIDQTMIEETRKKAIKQGLDIETIQSDMLSLKHVLTKHYDIAFCIGNSLAHLNSEHEIKQFLLQVYQFLEPDGRVIIQIINYDRIFNQNLVSLPTITNQEIGFTFERTYERDNQNHILFNTTLSVRDQKFNNTIILLPILSHQLTTILSSIGYKHIELFGDFKYTHFDENQSYHFIVRARK